MAELALLKEAGAVGFTDGHRAVADSLLMRRAMAYASALDGLIIQHPEDPALAAGGAMNEGEVATRLVANLVPFAHGFWFNRVPGLPRFFASFTSAYLGTVLLAPALYGLFRGLFTEDTCAPSPTRISTYSSDGR